MFLYEHFDLPVNHAYNILNIYQFLLYVFDVAHKGDTLLALPSYYQSHDNTKVLSRFVMILGVTQT